MVKRNPHLEKLHAGYLFPEIVRRKKLFLQKHPNASLISLGIGDTTQPLSPHIVNALVATAQRLGTTAGYVGYGPEEGIPELRSAISEKIYHNQISDDEIFVSDGTNCDIGRLQILFGSDITLAVQNPTYPVYVDTGVMLGQTGSYCPSQRGYRSIVYLPCTPLNDFFPQLDQIHERVDLVYFCSPNNPTGTAATRKQLEKLVQWTQRNNAILIYDSAYSSYIAHAEIPRSIFEIPGAREVAIELGSFSKGAGFTGVRLGWSAVPKTLQFQGGHSLHADWTRVHTTFFNGASILAQHGGLAALSQEGEHALKQQVACYMENASLLKKGWTDAGYNVYGGDNAPYLWVQIPKQGTAPSSSWDAFDRVLEKAHLLTVPGVGFGSMGDGFLRATAFAPRAHIEQAVERIQHSLHSIFSN